MVDVFLSHLQTGTLKKGLALALGEIRQAIGLRVLQLVITLSR